MAKFVERYLAPLYLAIALVFGGASAGGHLVNAGIQLLGLGVVLIVLLGDRLPVTEGHARRLLILFALAAALPALQLIPLPPFLWTLLPERATVLMGLEQLGVAPGWMPLTLSPDGTIAALLSLIPPLAMILAIWASSGYGRLYAVYVAVALAITSILLGLYQRLQGPDSALYFYEFTNRGGLVGFFANRNHLSTLLLCALPFLAALAVSPSRKAAADKKLGRRMVAGCALLFVAVGVVIVSSVAGWMLLAPTLLACLLIFQRGEFGRYSLASLQGAVAVAVIAVALTIFAPIQLNDLGDKLSGMGPNQRNETITRTLGAAVDHLLFGSGGGSFLRVYPHYEAAGVVGGEYVNHAHSDYAEIALEYGLPGVAIIVLALLWWASTFRAAWRGDSATGVFGRAGWVTVGVVVAHSLVDYPGRTAAIAALLGMAAALIVAPEPGELPVSQYRGRRKRPPSRRTIDLAPPPADVPPTG